MAVVACVAVVVWLLMLVVWPSLLVWLLVGSGRCLCGLCVGSPLLLVWLLLTVGWLLLLVGCRRCLCCC